MASGIDIVSASARIFEAAKNDLEYLIQMTCARYETRVESNIELMLLAAFETVSVIHADEKDVRPFFYISPTNEPAPDGRGVVIITPQYNWNGYRIDFRVDYSGDISPVFIECDGHDFHERTKEQAERDRSKDRKIQEAGISILRFTGREIFRNPIECVNQVSNFMMSRVKAKNGDA